MTVQTIHFHVCLTCVQVVGYRERIEHVSWGHDTNSLELYRHTRGRGNKREAQWSTPWVKDPEHHLEVVR